MFACPPQLVSDGAAAGTSYCPGSTLTLSAGLISDGPGDYASNAACFWLVRPARVITLDFIEFSTEAAYDTVNVYAVDRDGSESLRGSFSGATVPAGIRLVSDKGVGMKVVFTSDSSYEGAGFVASYTASDAPAAAGARSCAALAQLAIGGECAVDCSRGAAMSYGFRCDGARGLVAASVQCDAAPCVVPAALGLGVVAAAAPPRGCEPNASVARGAACFVACGAGFVREGGSSLMTVRTARAHAAWYGSRGSGRASYALLCVGDQCVYACARACAVCVCLCVCVCVRVCTQTHAHKHTHTHTRTHTRARTHARTSRVLGCLAVCVRVCTCVCVCGCQRVCVPLRPSSLKPAHLARCA